MSTPDDALLPPLRACRHPHPHVDRARRILWQAFERGELTEQQFAQTLERLEPEQAPAAPRQRRAQEE